MKIKIIALDRAPFEWTDIGREIAARKIVANGNKIISALEEMKKHTIPTIYKPRKRKPNP